MSFKIREAHWEIILHYMSAHPDLARGRLHSVEARKSYNFMWAELTTKLNSVGFGQKPAAKWQKSWSDYKVSLKKKAAQIERSRLLTGGGPGNLKSLSEFELKVLSLLGESFYKGIGVKEVGITTLKDPESNFETIESETLSLENHIPTTVFPVVSATQMIAPQQSQTDKDFEFVEQESISFLSSKPFKRPIQDVQQPSCSTDEQTQIPFRKKSRTLDNHSVFATEDGDYLANLPRQTGSKRTSSRSRRDNDMNHIYEETLGVLHSISNNVNRVANNLEQLASEFKTSSITIKEVLETLKSNLN